MSTLTIKLDDGAARLVEQAAQTVNQPLEHWLRESICPGGPSTGGTMCVVVRDDGAVLIVKPRYRRHWCLPGGFLDAGEHPALGAAREVAEETGARLQGEPTLLVTQRRWHHVEFLFSGRLDPDGWEEPTTAWEISAVRWTSPTDMQRLHPLSVRVTALVPGGLAGIVERTLAAGPLA